MSDSFTEFLAAFNAGSYRACVEPLEALWFRERDDFHKGLIRWCVALHQMQLGLRSSPRFLLETAAALLEPYLPRHRDLDLAPVLGHIRHVLALLPPGDERGEPLAVPPLLLSHPSLH